MFFKPKEGWCNDPNGTIYIDDTYHLFYQHYPYDTVWGPMHWGHAISKDAENWQHCPIALAPENDLFIYSGSCYYDNKGCTPFYKAPGVLLAYYTEHNATSGLEQQCVAYSYDMIHFTKYSQNPIIRNNLETYRDFRDPKVFENPIIGGLSMVLSLGRKIGIYHSTDGINWEKTGEADIPSLSKVGIFECPDLLNIDNEWILTFSYAKTCNDPVLLDHMNLNHMMAYVFVQFDGKNMIVKSQPKRLDYGPDDYASISFSNTKPLLSIGWAENWGYVKDSFREITKGKMTSVKKTMIKNDFLYFDWLNRENVEVYQLHRHQTLNLCTRLKENLAIHFKDNVIIDRSGSGNHHFSALLQSETYSKFETDTIEEDTITIEIKKEEDCFEIRINEIYWFTINTYSQDLCFIALIEE